MQRVITGTGQLLRKMENHFENCLLTVLTVKWIVRHILIMAIFRSGVGIHLMLQTCCMLLTLLITAFIPILSTRPSIVGIQRV